MAEVDIPPQGAEGVLLSFGGNEGRYSFYLENGHLHSAQKVVSAALLQASSVEPVPAGRHSLRFEFEPTGPADIKAGKGVPERGQLYVDGALVGQADFPATVPITYGLGGGLVCGAGIMAGDAGLLNAEMVEEGEHIRAETMEQVGRAVGGAWR